MAWMIARDDSENLTHYGVKGMKWKQKKAIVAPKSKVGMPTNSNAIKGPVYNPYGPVDKLNRPTHGSGAGIPSNLVLASKFTNVRTKDSQYYGDGKYRTSTVIPGYNTAVGNPSAPVRKLNTQVTNTPTQGTKFATSGTAIKKKLQSNSRYKGSRAGMAAAARRRGF